MEFDELSRNVMPSARRTALSALMRDQNGIKRFVL
jgi:hypothetical protein